MLPQDFIQQMCALLGEAEAGALCDSLQNTSPPNSIRLHRQKGTKVLAEVEQSPVPWCQQGRYLAERPSYVLDPQWHAGGYYVQEAASMFVEQVWHTIAADQCPHRLLDLCAAPGGKSTLWRSCMPDGSLLVANEPIRQRANILAENLTKWGHPDVVTTNAYPEELGVLIDFFDVVAADVPCSGEGMFRKDEQARSEWSIEAVEACAQRQRNIITDIWAALKVGGYLVYSTCTFNRTENEDNVHYICETLGAELISIDFPEEWGIVGDVTGRGMPVARFFPHRTQGEGLFVALLRKTKGEERCGSLHKDRRQKKPEISSAVKQKLETWLADRQGWSWCVPTPQTVAVARATLLPDVLRLAQTVRCLTMGVLVAEEKGNKLIPQHALALSEVRAVEAFPRVELSLEQARAYLRREAIVLPAEVERGYVVVTYAGLPLGWVNHLGTRSNNLYPQEWRIRYK